MLIDSNLCSYFHTYSLLSLFNWPKFFQIFICTRMLFAPLFGLINSNNVQIPRHAISVIRLYLQFIHNCFFEIAINRSLIKRVPH